MMMMMTVTMMIIDQVPQPLVLFKKAKYLYTISFNGGTRFLALTNPVLRPRERCLT